MKTQPSVVQVLAVVRDELSTAVAPAADAHHRKLLGMIDHLLQTIQVRAEHEIEWMVSHTRSVVALAESADKAGTASPEVVDALNRYREQRRESLRTSDVTANYALAAGILSAILEATVSKEDDVSAEARALLQADVSHGVDIVGDFVLVPP
jgi:hypothetical protein